MKKTDSIKEMILVRKLKAEDVIALPMEAAFFDNLHNKIMSSVAKTELKPVSRWTKTRVFLERKTIVPRAQMRKVVKLGITAATLAVGLGLSLNQKINFAQKDLNKSMIVSEAKKNPAQWSELVVNYQNENDFYADILSQHDLATIVEIDKAIAQSL